MSTPALSAYWCDHCRRVVCEAISGAAVWCPCGHKAREVRPGARRGHTESSRDGKRKGRIGRANPASCVNTRKLRGFAEHPG